MQCDVCGAEVGPEQKFCMECGARLHQGAPSDPTPAPPLELAPPGGHPMFDPVTGQLLALPPPGGGDPGATNALPAIEAQTPVHSPFAPPDPTPAPGVPWTAGDDNVPLWPGETYAPTRRQQQVERSTQPGYAPTTKLPANYAPSTGEDWDGEDWDDAAPALRPAFRVKPLLLIAIAATAAAVVAMFTSILDINAVNATLAGTWKLNDFGTNLTVAGIFGCAFMLFGALAWCGGFRWGAGLAGGAGAGLAGWAVLVIGLAELPIKNIEITGQPLRFTRDAGYWGLAAAAVLGVIVLIVSLVHAGGDGRGGLDPWVAALGAMAAIAAAVGPLIPIAAADVADNYSSAPGTDLPTWFFVARFGQLGLLLMCGVFGFLLVRRYGLGLAIGGAVVSGWMVLTSATEHSDFPIGPGQTNPGSAGFADRTLALSVVVGKPHAVTIVGVGLLFFFALVATAMALIDSDR